MDIELKKRLELFSQAEEKWTNEISSFGLDRICVDESTGKIIH